MPTQSVTIGDYPNCPDCGSEETISQRATKDMREKGKIAKDAFTHLEVMAVPLEQPAMAGVTVPTIIVHYDVCAGCGRRRCTRAEVIQAAVTMTPQQPQQVPFRQKYPGHFK